MLGFFDQVSKVPRLSVLELTENCPAIFLGTVFRISYFYTNHNIKHDLGYKIKIIKTKKYDLHWGEKVGKETKCGPDTDCLQR